MIGLDWFDLPVAMGWRNVLFANWPVDPAVVESHLPRQLTVDTVDGDAWLSVVPFTNVDVRPKGLPAAVGFDLPELNLRTYVTHEGEPGVYFFSLDADGLLGVVGARLFHHLPYFLADIELRARDGGGINSETVEFWSRRRHPGARPCDFVATYGPDGGRIQPGDDSLERFLTERYRYYTETPSGALRYAKVAHERWPIREADVTIERNQVFETNGFADPDREGRFLYSPGVDVVATGSETP